MRTGRGQRVAAAWAVRGQPCPAVGTELPMRGDLAAAIVALLEKLVKLLLELQECGLPPALLGLWLVLLVVHGGPSLSYCPPADTAASALVASSKASTCARIGSACCARRCVHASPAATFAPRMAIPSGRLSASPPFHASLAVVSTTRELYI